MSNVTDDDAPSRFEALLFERIGNSERFKAYQDAFRTATGLPLRLVDADTGTWCLDDECVNRSPFCEALNSERNACDACVETNRQLMEEAESKGSTTCRCFAGLCATAVPIRLGASIVGFLKTGQVFKDTPSEHGFDKVFKELTRKSISKKQLDMLKNAWLQTRTVEPERYESMIKLLNSFAEQLSQHVESLAIVEEGSQPVAISKARKYIHSRLDQPLPLSAVAHQAGLSESHFCRLFKEATGLTLTDYVNRCRIEWAKRELMRPEARVSEVAFLVGYQSLSQFNRSFARIVGQAPTSFRRRKFGRASA
jgi:AraC-like DNA-binding protein